MKTHADSRIDEVDPSAGVFQRIPTDSWTNAVAGSRWFKADLHVHTLDDVMGHRVKMPRGIKHTTKSDEWMGAYARRVLQDAVKQGIEVLGLTPHSAMYGTRSNTSVTWRIIDEWNQGCDDDGVPFCDKLYAVFPGFEPSLTWGSSGLHLIFLFDPEIGKERYLKLFNLIMGGVVPWNSNQLQLSSNSPADAFHELRRFHKKSQQGCGPFFRWDYLILAPHIDDKKGLLGAQKSQVLREFKHDAIAGLELGDNKLPADTTRNRTWLENGMKAHRQAFFHSSDAYSTDTIGSRYTWLKLAKPRIESLRQAFIASDSRLRLGLQKTESGDIKMVRDPATSHSTKRPWLKSVTLRGIESFFHRRSLEEHTGVTFALSPDLTCIIGGSMTGKSTLLDGLRVHTQAPLPSDEFIRQQVETRGRDRFANSIADIEFDCPDQHPALPLHRRWPAQFFAQNELQRLTQDNIAIQEILTRIEVRETELLEGLQSELQARDHELGKLADSLDKLDRDVADAQQAYDRAKHAKDVLAEYEEAGFDAYHQAGKTLQFWKKVSKDVLSVQVSIKNSLKLAQEIDISKARKLAENLTSEGDVDTQVSEVDTQVSELDSRWDRVISRLESTRKQIARWRKDAVHVIDELDQRKEHYQGAMEKALMDRGISGLTSDIRELSRRAALLPVFASTLDDAKTKWTKSSEAFDRILKDRSELVKKHRKSLGRVAKRIEEVFGGEIRVRQFKHGIHENMTAFLTDLKQRGITRWWNTLGENERPSPHELVTHLDNGSLEGVHMSIPVQETFRECLTKAKRRKLLALRCPDRYLLELRLDDGQYRGVHDLSGGQRVGLLLSLLLQTNDDRPLVIDQPEDELDNRYLFDRILPALKNLKGRRQVIVATHNANIVVNGDADLVIELQATANRGWIATSGTIDDPVVRDAIVRTVDGGVEAFQLRQKKYGF